jgi:magnesium-protoporphyrin O-methyltransferase
LKCCQCDAIESHFDYQKVTKELEEYQKKGPSKNTRMLIEAIIAEDITGKTLLDIGGGVGTIQHELLIAGVSECVNVEASSAYIEVAREEANRQNHADCISHLHGNFVDLAMDVPESDVVTLDRVICCYHDVNALVDLSSDRAREIYALVYPRYTWWTRKYTALENLILRIKRNPFRSFVHPTDVVEQIVRSKGFERRFFREVGYWQVVVYRRNHDNRELSE